MNLGESKESATENQSEFSSVAKINTLLYGLESHVNITPELQELVSVTDKYQKSKFKDTEMRFWLIVDKGIKDNLMQII